MSLNNVALPLNVTIYINSQIDNCVVKKISTSHLYCYKVANLFLDTGRTVTFLTQKGYQVARDAKAYGLGKNCISADAEIHSYIRIQDTTDVKETVFKGKKIKVTKIKVLAFKKNSELIGERFVWI